MDWTQPKQHGGERTEPAHELQPITYRISRAGNILAGGSKKKDA
jgi:hypothetical protein